MVCTLRNVLYQSFVGVEVVLKVHNVLWCMITMYLVSCRLCQKFGALVTSVVICSWHHVADYVAYAMRNGAGTSTCITISTITPCLSYKNLPWIVAYYTFIPTQFGSVEIGV